MTLPKKTAKSSRPPKQLGSSDILGSRVSTVRDAAEASITCNKGNSNLVSTMICLEDAVPPEFSSGSGSEVTQMRVSMIYASYRRMWEEVESLEQMHSQRLHQALKDLPQEALRLKLASLAVMFSNLKRAMNDRLCEDLKENIATWASVIRPEVTEASQRVLRVCTPTHPCSDPHSNSPPRFPGYITHMHNPYPSDEEKKLLAFKAGITVKQVNTWFGNHRGRTKRKIIDLQQYQDGPATIVIKTEPVAEDGCPPVQSLRSKRKRLPDGI